MIDNIETQILEQLKLCYDPEIAVNVVDLGLIYAVEAKEIAANEYHIHIKMTFTSPGCSMADFIVAEIKERLMSMVGVKNVVVETVFDPPWDKSMISVEARLFLGIL